MNYKDLTPEAQSRALTLIKLLSLAQTQPSDYTSAGDPPEDCLAFWETDRAIIINDDDYSLDYTDNYRFSADGWIISGEIEELLKPFCPGR